jgi:hypothetical protein
MTLIRLPTAYDDEAKLQTEEPIAKPTHEAYNDAARTGLIKVSSDPKQTEQNRANTALESRRVFVYDNRSNLEGRNWSSSN